MPISVDKFPCVPTLKYEIARSQIRSGDILMCSGNSVLSTLIKSVSGSIWSHVGFILWNREIDRVFVIESVETIGVRIVPLSFYTNNYDGNGKPYDGKLLIARHADFEHAHIKDLAKNAVDLLGHQYDKREIAKITMRIALSKISQGSECRYPEHDNAYICSEYAYECYKSIGIYIAHDCRGFVTPADFAKTKEVNAVFGLS
jgi:hypothetical protein